MAHMQFDIGEIIKKAEPSLSGIVEPLGCRLNGEPVKAYSLSKVLKDEAEADTVSAAVRDQFVIEYGRWLGAAHYKIFDRFAIGYLDVVPKVFVFAGIAEIGTIPRVYLPFWVAYGLAPKSPQA